MKSECVSVIVPIYKVADYLDQCIESIVSQHYRDLDIILVDDGSPDSCPEICDRWAAKDARIRVIHKANGGLSDARNAGVSCARGEYLCFVDGDDWIDPEMCGEAVSAARRHRADIVMWSYVKEFPNGAKPNHIFNGDRIFEQPETKSLLARRMVGAVGEELHNPIGTDNLSTAWCKLYQTDMIREHALKFIDLKVIGTHEDGLFNLEAFSYVNRVVYLNQCWYHYRKAVQGQLTRSCRKGLFEQYQTLVTLLESKGNALELEGMDQALFNRVCLSTIVLARNICRAEESFSKKADEIRQMLNSPRYVEAFRHFSVNGMPIHWKVYFTCCKLRWSYAVAAMAEITLRL